MIGDAFNSKLDIIKTIIENHFLPATCKLKPQEGSNVVIMKGIVQQTDASYRVYKDKIDIPCRLDPSRAYRQANYEAEIAVTYEYILHLPLDVNVEPTDKVIVSNEEFNIVKLVDVESYAATKTALLLGTDRFGA